MIILLQLRCSGCYSSHSSSFCLPFYFLHLCSRIFNFRSCAFNYSQGLDNSYCTNNYLPIVCPALSFSDFPPRLKRRACPLVPGPGLSICLMEMFPTIKLPRPIRHMVSLIVS